MNRLVLIDGNAILHRAYHALPPLTAPDGSVVNAVYGFTTMLYKIIIDLHPTHIAVAFDRPAPTFRKKLYKGYQASRPKLDDDLASQIPKVHDLVGAFGIKVFEKDGFEADDVIGTIAAKAISYSRSAISKKKETNSEETIIKSSIIDQVVIVTGDKDLFQLIRDQKVYVYMPIKGLSESKLYDPSGVKEKLGVTPDQIPDYKSLAGDSSDNYPGVAGIGPKTASDLLAKYGSLENLIKSIHDKTFPFSENVRLKLTEGEETAKLMKNLATIRFDVPLEIAIDDLRVTTLNTPAAKSALEGFRFPSLIKRLENLYNPVEPKKISKKLLIQTQAEKNEEQLSLI